MNAIVLLDSDFSENPAVCLEVDELDVFEQNVLVRCQEEIALDFCADLLYEFLCGVKIEIDQQLFEKLCEGVFVIKAVLGQKVQYKLPIFVIELVILGEKNHANQVFDHVGAEQLHRRQVLVHGEASLKHVVKILLVHPETEDQVENYMDDECLVLQNVRRVLPEEFLWCYICICGYFQGSQRLCIARGVIMLRSNYLSKGQFWY